MNQITHPAPIRMHQTKEDVGGRRKRKPKLGSGKRFAALKGKLAKRGVQNPGALAAFIGRKKFGAARMAKMSAAGRQRA